MPHEECEQCAGSMRKKDKRLQMKGQQNNVQEPMDKTNKGGNPDFRVRLKDKSRQQNLCLNC